MMAALVAALAIVVQDHAPLRAMPRAGGTVLTELWQGDVLEIRGESAGYLRVYDYRHERGGFLRSDAARSVDLSESAAPALLTVMRFLRDTPGAEALGISYGAAYLKAARPQAITAEPFDAMGQMAERLGDRGSGRAGPAEDAAPHLEVVRQLGVRMHTLEINGRVRVCYDGEMFVRVLGTPGAEPRQRARAALGLTRPECIDPDLPPGARAALDQERARVLDTIDDAAVDPLTRSRLRARRAGVWASLAYEEDRRHESSTAAAERARAELLGVHPDELGDDRRPEYVEAVLRVSAIRFSGLPPVPAPGPLAISATPGEPGQTCVELRESPGPLLRRCTYGIVRMDSAHGLAGGAVRVLAVQPLEGWRELWVFHQSGGRWTVDVISPGLDEIELGYVDFAGYAPANRRLLIAREVKDHGRFRRSFDELRIDDLAVVRQASSPDLLRDFGRWQDADWRRDTLALH